MDYAAYSKYLNEINDILEQADPSAIVYAYVTPDINGSGVTYGFRGKLTAEYGDGKYLLCSEAWVLRGTQFQRKDFSLHYGDGPQGKDNDGRIMIYPNSPVDIRIDKERKKRLQTSAYPVHLHLAQPRPHYAQNRVTGLILENIEMRIFVRAVVDNRAAVKPLLSCSDLR